MDIIRKNIASNLTKLRTHAKLTQAELAEKISYSDKSISKWERAESVPDIYVLNAIAELFGVTVDYLLQPHADEEKPITKADALKHNRLVITGISVLGLLSLLTVIFATIWATTGKTMWITYIIGLPIVFILLLVFNTLWFNKRNNLYIISLLLWSLILAIYLSLLVFCDRNIWMLFIVGAPAQAVTILSFNIIIKGKIKSK